MFLCYDNYYTSIFFYRVKVFNVSLDSGATGEYNLVPLCVSTVTFDCITASPH